MPIYHLHAQVIGRSSGRSSVAAAAYRLGVRLEDPRTGLVHDFTRKGGVFGSFTFAPPNAPQWASDPKKLWGEVELVEKRKDAQTAREFDIAIPRELPREKMIELVQGFAQEQFVDKGMCVSVAFHDLDGNNPHFHLMATTRTIGPDGFGQKNRDWNKVEQLEEWREQWAKHANRFLIRSYIKAKIDHRSHAERGILEEPTTHIGVAGMAMARKGVIAERVERVIEALKGTFDEAKKKFRNALLALKKEGEEDADFFFPRLPQRPQEAFATPSPDYGFKPKKFKPPWGS